MSQACVMMRLRQEQQLFTPGKPPQADNTLITSTVRKRKVDPADSPLLQHGASLLVPDGEGKRQRTPPVDRGLAHSGSDAVVRITVAPALKQPGGSAAATPALAPAALLSPARQQDQDEVAGAAARAQQAGGSQQPPQQQRGQRDAEQAQQDGDDGVLFSPLFHLHKEAGAGEATQQDERPAAGASLAAQPAVDSAQPPLPGRQQQPAVKQPAREQQENTEGTSTDHSTGTSASLADADAGADVASPQHATCLAVASPAPAPACAQAAAEEEPEEYLEFDPLLFIKRLPPLERCVPPRREFLLPKKTRRSKQKTLVLDLDETLVHSTLDGYCRPDFVFPVEVGSMKHIVSVRQRPHLHTFLERVAQLYEVVVFTASQRVYAEQLLNIVDPERRLVRHRVYRDSCVFWEGNYLKDLTVLGRDLAHTIIVDNSPQAFGFQLDNGIPIESWYDDDADEELLKLIPFLERVAHADDVRPHIQNRYRLRSLVEAAADPEPFLYQHLQQRQL